MATTGIVQEVKQRQVKTKYGLKPVYDLVINNNKYGWGFKDPTLTGISIGTEISFDELADKYGPKIIVDSVLVGGQGKTPPAKTSSAAGNTTGYRERGSFPISKASGEFAIIRQNALTNARELCTYCWHSVDGVAEPDTIDESAETIIRIANIFADYSSGQREVKAAEKITSKHGGKAAKAVVGNVDATVNAMLLDEYCDEEDTTAEAAE
jgi:hypothetical protein